MEDKQYSDVRDKFFSGELHASAPSAPPQYRKSASDIIDPSPEDLFHRIDGRLRRVVVKACENSAPACKIVESFENYLIAAFDKDDDNPNSNCWEGVLLERPSVSHQEGVTHVTFLFDGESTSGGFHRILVHAVSQFHCLKVKTFSQAESPSEQSARGLSVKGGMRGGNHRLLDYLTTLQEQKQRH
jgi:hypothetical protein